MKNIFIFVLINCFVTLAFADKSVGTLSETNVTAQEELTDFIVKAEKVESAKQIILKSLVTAYKSSIEGAKEIPFYIRKCNGSICWDKAELNYLCSLFGAEELQSFDAVTGDERAMDRVLTFEMLGDFYWVRLKNTQKITTVVCDK